MRKWPLGARGERPVVFPVEDPQWVMDMGIPGVARKGNSAVRTTWDNAEVLAERLGVPCPRALTEDNLTDEEFDAEVDAMPGLAEYTALGFPKILRHYQKFGAFFLARRSHALMCDYCRLGKCIESIAGAILAGHKHVLIVAPARVIYVWTEELWKWAHEQPLVLEGRAVADARRWCGPCMGAGCELCRGRNGQPIGAKLFSRRPPVGVLVDRTDEGARYCPVPRQYMCRKHRHVRSIELPMQCEDCKNELREALYTTRFVLVSQDLVVRQLDGDAAGKLHVREDLPGWANELSAVKFDCLVVDEAHNTMRVNRVDKRRQWSTRRDRICTMGLDIPVAWLLTATPEYGYTRDLFGLMEAVSKGASTGTGHRDYSFRTFGDYFCQGHLEFGYVWNGTDPRVETELRRRLKVYMLQRMPHDVMDELPSVSEQTIRLDDPKAHAIVAKVKPKAGESATVLGLRRSFDVKLDTVLENVSDEVLASGKCIVWTFTVENCLRFHDEAKKLFFPKKMTAEHKRAEQVGLRIWCVHGKIDAEARLAMAREFRTHCNGGGAGLFVATMGSIGEGVSLQGASSEHFLDLHWDPGLIQQCRERCGGPGAPSYSVLYYVVNGSYDERVLTLMLPKAEAQEAAMPGKGGAQLRAQFVVQQTPSEELELELARIKSVDDVGDVDYGEDLD